MAFDGIDIEIGGSAGGAKGAISSVRSSLSGLERSANDAKDSVEELGDDVTGTASKLSALGGTAGATAVSLTGLSTAGTGASTSLTALGVSAGTLTAGLVGLSAVAAPLAATLGTVAAAAGGLATAFGAVVGSGLVAFGEKRAEQNREELQQINERIARLETLEDTEQGLTAAQERELTQLEEKKDRVEETTSVTGALGDALSDVVAEIKPLVVELGQRFVPLIEDALDALPTLVAGIIDALGPLDAFRAALRDFGGAAMDAIPAVVEGLVDLGRRALPFVERLTTAVGDGAAGAFEAMIRVTEQVGDDLLSIGGALADVIPDLTELGVIIIEAAEPALTALIDGIDTAVAAFNDFARSDGASQLVSQFRKTIDAAKPAIRALRRRVQTAADAFVDFIQSQEAADILRSIRQEIIPLIPRVIELSNEFRPLLSALVDNLPEIIRGTAAFADSVLDLARPIIEVLVPALTTLVNLIGDVAGAYADWVERSEESEEQLAGDIASLKSDILGFASDVEAAFIDVVNGIVSAFNSIDFSPLTDGLNTLAGGVNDLIDGLNDLPGVDIDIEVPTVDDISPDVPGVSPGNGGGGGGDDGGGGGGGGGSVGGGPTGGSPGTPGDGVEQGLVGGGSGVGPVPTANTGGLIERSGLALVHEGERVVPEAQVADRGRAPVEGADADAIAAAMQQTDRTDEVVSRLEDLTRVVSELGRGDVSQKDVLQALDVARDRRGGRDPLRVE